MLPAILATLAGAVTYWRIPDTFIDAAGPERYLKDIVTFGFAIYWPMVAKPRTEVVLYIIWIMVLTAIGMIAYILNTGYLPFIIAGIRWITVLHDSFGIYILIDQYGVTKNNQRLILGVALFWLACSLVASYIQFSYHGNFSSVGSSREPGIFSLAGVNGYYAASVAVIAMASRHATVLKWLGYLFGILIGVLSGTRFTILCILVIIFLDNLKRLRRFPIFRVFIYSTVLPSVLLLSIFAAGSLSGRGDVVNDQMQDGGRLGNGSQVVQLLVQTGDFTDLTVGRGLGQGTNGAMQMVKDGQEIPKWQILVDNTFITSFIQFGLIGFVWLFGGIFLFLWSRRAELYLPFYLIVLISLLTQNVFEQLFWMLSIAYYLGSSKYFHKLRQYRPTADATLRAAASPV
ncbi:hypothetical protein ACFSGX_02370 [Sphingomonas arantia]|uniref:O-antigen ligase domain-containing protein n=2 Tax=Sphingomonas arantia TaxID=1460676 RepID=A0ABW4TUI4_9SPHN